MHSRGFIIIPVCFPAHYVVIKDDSKLGADQLQSLTHFLCYAFAHATRSVSICPPAYYADLLCERGRAYLHSRLKGDVSTDFTNWCALSLFGRLSQPLEIGL